MRVSARAHTSPASSSLLRLAPTLQTDLMGLFKLSAYIRTIGTHLPAMAILDKPIADSSKKPTTNGLALPARCRASYAIDGGCLRSRGETEGDSEIAGERRG